MSPSVDSHREVPQLFPGIVTSRLDATCRFYREFFNMVPDETQVDHVLLAGPGGMRLGLLPAGDNHQPAALQSPARGAGIWLRLEVDNFDSVFRKLRAAGAEIILDPELTPSGVRRFVVRDPNGVLLFVTPRCAPRCRAVRHAQPEAAMPELWAGVLARASARRTPAG